MSEGIKPYNPESDKPSEFLGNWADGSVADEEELIVTENAKHKAMLEADDAADREIYRRMDLADMANYYRESWNEFDFKEQVKAAQFMLDHPEFIPDSGHTKAEFQEVVNRSKLSEK